MLAVEELEPRDCPSVDITYGGGPLIQHVAVADLHADPSTTSYTDAAMRVVLSQYLPLLTPAYGVGAGTLVSSLNVAPLAGNPSNAQIQQFLAREITAGLVPQPGASQVYVYILAPGQRVSDPQFNLAAGYHSYFMLNGQPVYYNVDWNFPSDQESQIEAHEIAETVTDPQPLSGWVDRAFGGEGEVADILMWQPQYQFALGGFLFSACAALDGSPILPVPVQQQPVPVQQQPPPVNPFVELATLAREQFSALAYRALAFLDPKDFAGPAAAAQQELASNALLQTPQGRAAAAVGWVAFAEAVGGTT